NGKEASDGSFQTLTVLGCNCQPPLLAAFRAPSKCDAPKHNKNAADAGPAHPIPHASRGNFPGNSLILCGMPPARICRQGAPRPIALGYVPLAWSRPGPASRAHDFRQPIQPECDPSHAKALLLPCCQLPRLCPSSPLEVRPEWGALHQFEVLAASGGCPTRRG